MLQFLDRFKRRPPTIPSAQVPVVTETGIHRVGPLYIPYDLTCRPGRPLVVVFSGVDGVPGRCITSYFGFHKNLDASVLSIGDTIGTHGCYMLSQVLQHNLLNAAAALIEQTIEKLSVPDTSLYLVGTSKGGTIALCVAMVLGRGKVIAGEPQVMLGDFLYPKHWETSEVHRAIAYAIKGRVNPDDAKDLNLLVKRVIWTLGTGFRGHLEFLYSPQTGYLNMHLRNLVAPFNHVGIRPDQWMFRSIDIATHNEIMHPFISRIRETIGFNPA